MIMKKSPFSSLAIAVLLMGSLTGLVGTSRAADEMETLRATVLARSAQIMELKQSGHAVEQPNGLLQPVPPLTPEQQGALDAENKDRRKAFSLIAEKNGLQSSDISRTFATGARSSSNPVSAQPTPSSSSSPTSSTATPASGSLPSNPAPSPGANVSATPDRSAPSPGVTPSSTVSSTTATSPADQDSSMPAKLINKPGATIYATASDSAVHVSENLPGFQVYYQVATSPGWIQISKVEGGSPLGWIKEGDAILWRHNLAVRFAHEGKGNRQRVVFFKTDQDLGKVMQSADAERVEVVTSASDPSNQAKAVASGVVAVQPALVTRNQFYVLPIISHREALPSQYPFLKGESRLLDIAAMSQNASQTQQPQQSAPQSNKKPSMDVVFCMDLTSSMQPSVDAAKEAMKDLAESIEKSGVSGSVKFGFWGYKDSPPDETFEGGKVTKNFTRDLVGRSELVEILNSVRVSKNATGDYSEEVFGGVKDAVTKTEWTPDGIRVIVLIGDASSHPEGDPKNKDHNSADTIREIATRNKCYILPIYIQRNSPAAKDDRDQAKSQFTILGKNPNLSGDGLYHVVPQENSEALFKKDLGSALGELVTEMGSVLSSQSPLQKTPAGINTQPSSTGSQAAQMAKSIFAGAYLDWIASQPQQGQKISNDLQGWACDKDLVSSGIQSLDVVYLINKSQLDTLAKLLDQIIDAGVRSKVRGIDFFDSLKNVVGTTAVNPNQLGSQNVLGSSANIPDFLKGLPYKSELLSLTKDEWRGMSAQDQAAFLDRLNSNIAFYREISRDPSQWKPLNPDDDPGANVAAIPLDRLP